MENEKMKLKPYHGIIMIVLAAICVFCISPILGMKLGLYGTLINEILILVLAIAVAAVFGGSLKEVFPIHKPRLSQIFGTILLWMGTFLGVMILTMLIAYFFPEPMLEVSEGLGMEFISVSFLVAFAIVSISPAICEEAVFRGVVLKSFSGFRSKWAAIILTGVIFGAFHGSIWRFVPTALLGIMLGYIVFETNNMLYAALFHAINNLTPLISLFAMKNLYAGEMYTEQAAAMMSEGFPLVTVGVYLMYGAAIPFLVYVGNYLIHRGQAGYEKGLFGKEDRMQFFVLLAVSLMFLIVGVMVVVCSFIADPMI